MTESKMSGRRGDHAQAVGGLLPRQPRRPDFLSDLPSAAYPSRWSRNTGRGLPAAHRDREAAPDAGL